MSDFTVHDLEKRVKARAGASPETSYTRRLLDRGVAHCAKKLGEEAIETVLAAANEDRDRLIAETADLIYHLVVLWGSAGVHPREVWKEMDRRERLLGIAEKLPKIVGEAESRRKIVALDSRRPHKRR